MTILRTISGVSRISGCISKGTTRITPIRELDLTIELNHGTQPISKTPYRMTAPKLQELQIELKELLDIGHIRPSISPWGAPVIFSRRKMDP